MRATNNTLAYYPGDKPLYEGPIELRTPTDDDRPGTITYVQVDGHPNLSFALSSQVERPLRTAYTADFLRQSKVINCNVDLELDPQPNAEEVARAIIHEELIAAR